MNLTTSAHQILQQNGGGDEGGSWDPNGHYGNCWGRVGSTALCVLCLEVYYRYLPMYRE